MNQLSKAFRIVLIISGFSGIASAQELNVGLNISPVISMPVLDGTSTHHPAIRTKRFNVNATGGLNINVRMNNFCIETGANASSRSIVFILNVDDYSFNNLNSSSSIAAQDEIRSTGYSFSVPVILGYKLHHHDLKTRYDVFGILGASYDSYMFGAEAYRSTSSNSGGMGSVSVTDIVYASSTGKSPTNWVNIIAGFKINAILRHVGLVEYGLRYHYPLSNSGKYVVDAVVTNNIYGSVYNGTFYPRLSYFDFHISWYFLNLEAGTGIKKYIYK